MQKVYLDHAATTPLDPMVFEAMLPWLRENFHNPSSLYEGGRKARMAIDEARERVASAIAAHPGEIVFTSSGTEAANTAILGTALAYRGKSRNRILFGSTEHVCVLDTKEILESFGYRVEIIPVTLFGIDFDALEERMKEDVLLVSVMHANNETGAVYDASRVGEICRRYGAFYACDAVQSFGLLPVDVEKFHVDFLWVASHKIYGPKGVGALYVRAGVKPRPLIVGGGQEREMRAGTENVAGIVGFAKAVELALKDTERARRIANLRNRFIAEVEEKFESLSLPKKFSKDILHNPPPAVESRIKPLWTLPYLKEGSHVLPGHAHFRVPGANAEAVLINLDRAGIAASSGAACSSGSLEPSHVMLALGFSEKEAREALRFSFGKDNTEEDIHRSVVALVDSVGRVLRIKNSKV